MSAQTFQVVETRRCEGCDAPIGGKTGKRFCNAKCRATVSRTRRRERVRVLLRTVKDTIAELEELVGRE
jgi:predicted nucleic acid-binding Zn ribbon protein